MGFANADLQKAHNAHLIFAIYGLVNIAYLLIWNKCNSQKKKKEKTNQNSPSFSTTKFISFFCLRDTPSHSSLSSDQSPFHSCSFPHGLRILNIGIVPSGVSTWKCKTLHSNNINPRASWIPPHIDSLKLRVPYDARKLNYYRFRYY